MKPQYRDIIKHSGVYGLGQVLARLASVLLLPLYTHYLTPADYGCIAILDLTAGVMAILIGSGMVAAANRYHFDSDDPRAQDLVWWTGLAVVTATATALVVPAILARDVLAYITLGRQEPAGAYFYALVLPTLWFATISQVPDRYLRVRKWSWASVAISSGQLLLNIALNVYFLTVMHLGVAGVLWGNLITGVTATAVRCAILAWACWPFGIQWGLAGHMWRFGAPMVVTALLATAMHQADRYLLRLFVGLDQIGVYSLAYTIGQGVNALCLAPFSAIWAVVMYEIAQQPEAKQIYARVFEHFVYALLLTLLGVSLVVTPLLAVFVSPEYIAAGPLVPIVCLGFVFFSLHEHFSVPAYVAKKTVGFVFVYAAAAVANIVFTLFLVPVMGVAGAAWASVVGYAVFSGVGLMRYRQIDRFEYPLARCGIVLLAMVASYVGCQFIATLRAGLAWRFGTSSLVWTVWAVTLLYPIVKKQLSMRSFTAAAVARIAE